MVSPFSWSAKLTKNDLIEMLTSLDELGAVNDIASGGKASFKSLVTAFEMLFNIDLPKSYKKREEVINRKTKATSFISQMMSALIDKSQK